MFQIYLKATAVFIVSFPVKFKEFASVVLPQSILELMKCHLTYQKTEIQTPFLTIRRVDILDRKRTNKHVRNTKSPPKENSSGTHS